MSLVSRHLAMYLGVASLAAFIVQLTLGVSPWVLLSAFVIVLLGLLGFVLFGAYNTGSWLLLFYVLGNILVALYAKTLMGQPLDSYLYAPIDSFLALAISTGTLFLALLIAKKINLGRSLLRPIYNVKKLSFLSWGSFIIGVVFWFANQYFQGPGGTGFGGFAAFRDLILMAVIARTALLITQGDRTLVMDMRLMLILSVAIFLGLLTNTKTQAAYPAISYFATVLFYRRGMPWRQVVMLAVGGAFFVMVLVPMVQAWRYLGEQQMTTEQRVKLITEGSARIVQGHNFEHYKQFAESEFRGGYYDYFGGDGRGQMLLGRYASVQQIDPIISQVNKRGEIGGSVIWPAFSRLLPKFIDPHKPKYIEDYHIVVDLGLMDPAGGKSPTVPLAGQAYAGYGWLGVLTIPFVTFLGFLLVLKKLSWNLYRNVFAIFFFCEFVIVYAGQGDLGEYAEAGLRNFPIFFFVFWVLILLSRLHSRSALEARQIPVTTGPQ